MNRIFALLIALTVASCGTLPNPITGDRLTTIKQGYGLVLSAAIAYRDACAQRLISNSCRIVVPQLQNANGKVEIALGNLNRVRAMGANISYVQALDALSDAVNDFKVIASQNGVH